MRSKNRTIILITALSIGLDATAQDANIRCKIKAESGRKGDKEWVIKNMVKGDEGALVALKVPLGKSAWGGVPQGSNPWILETFDRKDLRSIKRTEHKMVYGIGPVAMETIVRQDRKVWLIGTKAQKEKGTVAILAQEIDPRSLTARKGAFLLAELPYGSFGKEASWFAADQAVGLEAELAVDSSAFVLRISPESSTKVASPHFTAVFRKDRTLYWARSLQADPAARDLEVLSSFCDGEGSVWYLVKHITDPKPKGADVLGYEMVVCKLDSSGQSQVALDLPGSDVVRHARMVPDKNGRPLVVGVYAEKEMRRERSAGLFQVTLDGTSLEWGPFKKHEFQKKTVDDKVELQRDMYVHSVHVLRNNGVVALCDERDLRTEQSKNFANQPITRESYINRDMHVMRLDGEGDLVWYTVVARNVSLGMQGPGDPVALSHGNGYFILINDEADNEEVRKEGGAVPEYTGGGESLILEFQEGGSYKTKMAIDDRYGTGFIRSDVLWPTSGNEICLLGAYKLDGEETFPIAIQFEESR